MLTSKDVAIVYETLLTSPGMNESVKISLSIPRKNVLLLSKLLEVGLSVKDENGQGGLLATLDNESVEELKAITTELLKSGINGDVRQTKFFAYQIKKLGDGKKCAISLALV